MKTLFFALLLIIPKLSHAVLYADEELDPSMAQSTILIVLEKRYCSAVAISEKVALTAAHCFDHQSDVIVPVIGVATYVGSKRPSKIQRIENSRILKYKSEDLALIQFGEEIENVVPAKYLINPILDFNLKTSYCFLGAGRTESSNSGGTLHQLCQNEVDPVVRSGADEQRPHLQFLHYFKNLKNNKGGSNVGDSGSPMYVNLDGKIQLAGIVSGGGDVEGVRYTGFVSLQSDDIHKWVWGNLR